MIGQALSGLSGMWNAASGSIRKEVSANATKARMKSQSQLSARDMVKVSRSRRNEAGCVTGGEARRVGDGAAAQEKIRPGDERRALFLVAGAGQPATGGRQSPLHAVPLPRQH